MEVQDGEYEERSGLINRDFGAVRGKAKLVNLVSHVLRIIRINALFLREAFILIDLCMVDLDLAYILIHLCMLDLDLAFIMIDLRLLDLDLRIFLKLLFRCVPSRRRSQHLCHQCTRRAGGR